jgi:hypothetical protein
MKSALKRFEGEFAAELDHQFAIEDAGLTHRRCQRCGDFREVAVEPFSRL